METSTPLSMNRAAHLRSTPLVINQPNHQDVQPALKIPPSSPIRHQECCAYVALGSNIGNRIKNIENACRELTKRGLKVLRTSALYETKAMYFEDQPPFLNGVCEISLNDTRLFPIELLDQLQSIEQDLGREKTIDKGPRNIDLDILLYENQVVRHDRLQIPHPLMFEREFVMRPLCDLIPNSKDPRPLVSKTFADHLAGLPKETEPISSVTALGLGSTILCSQNLCRPTRVMGILNLTPDSFSDGGIHSLNPKSLIPLLERYIKAGVTIIDVGGQSTRPQAPEVSTDEEISRVLPLIQYIRSEPRFDCLAISIDTYRASVASAAVKAGANIVNDVSAGVMDPEMLDTVAKLGCTIVLMHMRGTPATMNSLTSYEPDGLIPTISSELLTRVTAAEAAGIFRWRIILDPGIGFAKNQAQNLEILAQFSDLRDWQGLRGFPWVVGTSRKSFIGRITSVQEPGKRQWGTAATITAAIQGGADIIRVHDVMEMTQVAKMADALWRRVPSDAKVVKTVEQTKDPEKY